MCLPPPPERELNLKRRQTARIHEATGDNDNFCPPTRANLTLGLHESLIFDLRLKNHEKFKTILATFQLSMSYRFRNTTVQSTKIPRSSACCQSANAMIKISF